MKRDTVVRLARKAGIAQYGLGFTCWEGQLERFADLVAQHEREECALECIEIANDENITPSAEACSYDCASAIRARGGK